MDTILTVIDSSFGEVDWILPVLFSLRSERPDWTFVSLFLQEKVYNQTNANHFLFSKLSEVSDYVVVGSDMEEVFAALTPLGASPGSVRIILKDFSTDRVTPAKVKLAQLCPQALLVSYPHSNYPYSIWGRFPLKQCPDPDAHSKHDLFLLCSEHDRPFWSGLVDNNKIFITGYPRYDRWWITSLLSSPFLLSSPEWQLAHQARKTYFFISRGPHRCYLTEGDYDYLAQSTIEACLAEEESFLLIKAHPRQDLKRLQVSLSPYPQHRWVISNLHLIQLASLADVVVSGWSSGIMDALAVNKPVCEFWKYGADNPDWLTDASGKRTSTFRELGLARAVDTKEELEETLASVNSITSNGWVGEQIRTFEKVCHQFDNASRHTANMILDKEAARR